MKKFKFLFLASILSVGVLSTTTVKADSITQLTNDNIVEELSGANVQEGEKFVLAEDIALTSPLLVTGVNKIAMDGAGHTITFTASEFVKDNLLTFMDMDVNLSNINIIATNNIKSALHLYRGKNSTLQNVSITKSSATGSAIIVNGSTVTMAGNNKITVSDNAWQGFDIDQGVGVLSSPIVTFSKDSKLTYNATGDILLFGMTKYELHDAVKSNSDYVIINTDGTYKLLDKLPPVEDTTIKTDDETIEVVGKLEPGVSVTSNELKKEEVSAIVETIKDKEFLKEAKVEAIFDIKMMKDNAIYTPTGELVVKIALPTELVNKLLDVAYIDDQGNVTLMNATIENGFIVFNTTHFSHYAIVSKIETPTITTPEKEPVKDKTVATGDTTVMFGMLSLFIVSGICIFNLTKKEI